jgi:hypothetical protein
MFNVIMIEENWYLINLENPSPKRSGPRFEEGRLTRRLIVPMIFIAILQNKKHFNNIFSAYFFADIAFFVREIEEILYVEQLSDLTVIMNAKLKVIVWVPIGLVEELLFVIWSFRKKFQSFFFIS